MNVATATRSTPRMGSGPTIAPRSRSTPRSPAASSGAMRVHPDPGAPSGPATAATSSAEASAGEGYQASSSRPSGRTVASPAPQAPVGDEVASLIAQTLCVARGGTRSLRPVTDLLARTAELVAIPSESHAEAAIADHVEARLRALGHLDTERVGDNVVARTRG